MRPPPPGRKNNRNGGGYQGSREGRPAKLCTEPPLCESPEPGPISPLPEGPRATLQPTPGPRGTPARGGGASAPGTSAPANCLATAQAAALSRDHGGLISIPGSRCLGDLGRTGATVTHTASWDCQDQGKPRRWESAFPQGEAGVSPSVAPVSSKRPTVRLGASFLEERGHLGRQGQRQSQVRGAEEAGWLAIL